MSFFQRRLSKSYFGTCHGFNLGAPEAEGDKTTVTSFLDVFDDFVNIKQQIEDGKFLILGRKGVGKSAFVQYVLDEAVRSQDFYTDVLNGNDLLLNAVPHDDGADNVPCEQWFEWIVLTRLAKMIVKSGLGTHQKEVKSLNEFLKKNAGLVDIDKWNVVEIVRSKGCDINILPIRNLLTAAFRRNHSAKLARAPFHSILPDLKDVTVRTLKYDLFKDVDFTMMFDDLDVSFNLNDTDSLRRLLALLRIAKEYNLILSSTATRIIVFMRDDMMRRMEGLDSDCNKLFTSYSYMISWYLQESPDMAETDILLRRFINKRIAYNFKTLGMSGYDKSDPWQSFVDESSRTNPDRTLFRSLLDYTLYRPRDILLLFNNVGSYNYRLPLSESDLRVVISHSAERVVAEWKDELAALFTRSEIQSIFEILRCCADTGGLSYKAVIDGLSSRNLHKDVFQSLLEYNLLIPSVDNKQFYSYREQVYKGKPDGCTYKLPKILYSYLRDYYRL